MKARMIIIFLIYSTIVSAQETSKKTSGDFKKLDWLMGTWNRTNAKPGRSGHERWQKTGDEWIGFGVSMNGHDTAFVEKLKIIIKDDVIYYVSDVPENKLPVYFKFIEITATGFACENQAHDFPKKIAYRLEGTKLKATISGDGKSLDYLFDRKY